MGIYQLVDGYELKGWRNIPFALVDAKKGSVKKIRPAECVFFMSCDGTSEVDEVPEAEKFLKRGVIRRVDPPGEERSAGPAEAGGALSVDGRAGTSGGRPTDQLAGEMDAGPAEDRSAAPSYEFLDQLFRPVAQLAITGRCNLHCRHCLAADGDENVSSQLSLAQCDHIFAELAANGVSKLWITGGEPLIHPDFREIFMSAVAHGLRVDSIFTNAWLVDPELLDFVEAAGQRLQFVVSFDGIGTHDWMRNHEGAEERTLAKIALLRERDFPVRIGLNVNSVTAPGVIDTCRALVRDFGVTSLRPIYTSPTPRWNAALNGGVATLAPGDYYDLMIDLLHVSREEGWGVPIDIVHMPRIHQAPKNPKLWDALRTPPEPRPGRTVMSSCGRASSTLFIGSDGRVLPCSTYEGETNVLGIFQGDDVNILKTPLREILTDSEYTREFEVTVADLEQSSPSCAGCEWLSVCCGGCPLYTLGSKYTDGFNDPICTMYKGGYATKYLEMLEETER